MMPENLRENSTILSQGIAVLAEGKNPEKWSSEEKFAIVLEAALLNEAELAEYCRQKVIKLALIQ